MKRIALFAALALLLCACPAGGADTTAPDGAEEEMDLFAPLHGSEGFVGLWTDAGGGAEPALALYDGGFAELSEDGGVWPMNWTEENGTLVLSGGGWEHIYVLTQDGALEDGNGARLVRSIGQEPRTALMTQLPQGRWEFDRVTGADGALSAQGGAALVFESGAAALYLNGGMTGPYPAALEGGRARIDAGGTLLYACMRENGAVTIRIGGLEFWFVRAQRG